MDSPSERTLLFALLAGASVYVALLLFGCGSDAPPRSWPGFPSPDTTLSDTVVSDTVVSDTVISDVTEPPLEEPPLEEPPLEEPPAEESAPEKAAPEESAPEESAPEEAPGPRRPAHLDTALAYVGLVETKSNWRPRPIERFLEAVDIGFPAPYCAAFVAFVLEEAGAERPVVHSGLAYHLISKSPGSIPARKVVRGTEEIEPGTVLVWRKGNTIKGHAGFALSGWDGARGRTVEANTGPDPGGSQREGDGVYQRTRSIRPGSYFRITHFVPVLYDSGQALSGRTL